MDARMPYGLDVATGKLVSVSEVPNGLGCGAVCPGCEQSLVARNAGIVRQHHFAHHHKELSCESWLHATAKRILFERESNSILAGNPIVMGWQCAVCGCRQTGNLLKKVARVDLERYVDTTKRIKPDLIAYNERGQIANCQEVVVTHKPEPHTHYFAKSRGVPLLIYRVSSTNDLEALRNKPLRPDVHYVPCLCDKKKCDDCGQLPCDDAASWNPVPHKRCDAGPIPHCIPTGSQPCYCFLCKSCVEDLETHRHCACGNVITGQYPRCFCCHVNCQERDRDHRHCPDCNYRGRIYRRKRMIGEYFERCYNCEQAYRARAVDEPTLRAKAVDAHTAASKPAIIEPCANCRYGCQYVCFLS